MNLSKPFIKRPVMATLIMLPLIVFGIYSYKLLPVSTIPVMEPPIIQVSTTYPGASPNEMGRLVAGPLERQFMLMQGIEFVSSQNNYQTSSIICQFHKDVNVNVAAQEVQNAIDKAQGQLPQNLPNPPTYVKSNPSNTPILYAVIHSDTIPAGKLYEYGYTFLGQQVGTVNGVADIDTYGFPYAVRIRVDPQALAAKDIALSEVAQAINQENPDQPTGKFYGPYRSIVTNVKGQIFDADKYNDLIIKYQDGDPVRIRDVGLSSPGLQNNKEQFKWIQREKDGLRRDAVVVLAIFKQQGYNTLKVCTEIEQLLNKLKDELPPSINFSIPFTQSTYIQEAVNEVQFTLLVAFSLVVLVVFVYLGKVRNSVIPLITLPITVIGTFVLMYLFGFSIDIMSMSALTLSIGFLVDDAIVVLENIVRHVEMGKSPQKGAFDGSKQIILTVVSISLCLAIVFVPLLFMAGTVGKIFHEFAAVILIAILFSAFISLSLTPMLCSRFVPPHGTERKTRMELFSDKVNDSLLKYYEPALKWFLHHKKWVAIFCLVNLAASVYLFVILPKEFLPKNDLGVVEGFIVADQGTSPDEMDKILEELEKVIMKNKHVHTMARMSSTPTDNQSMFFMNLVPVNKRPSVWEVIKQVQKEIDQVVGVKIFMKSFPLINLQIGNMTAGKANYQYILQGFDQDELFAASEKLLAALQEKPELSSVNSNLLGDTPILDVTILRDRAHTYGNLNALDVQDAFMYAYGETYISKINEPQNMYYVILENTRDTLKDPQDTSLLYVGKKSNRVNDSNLVNEDLDTFRTTQVAINSVTDQKLVPGAQEINHINTVNSVTIAFNVGEGYALSDSIKVVEEVAKEIVPPTIMKSLAGNTAAFKKTFEQLTVLLLLAVFVIYIILGILYENFIQPITPLSALPVAVFGGLATLLIFNEKLSIYALIGLIMLIGIVMKNGILIVDFALEEMNDNGKSPYDAVVSACLVRFRPIIMTTLAAMMGSIPVAMGVGGTVAQGRAPLGMVVVGGLAFSQVVTLFVIPAFFLFVSQVNKHCVEKYKLFRPIAAEDEEDKEGGSPT